jgi:hypothetical protein
MAPDRIVPGERPLLLAVVPALLPVISLGWRRALQALDVLPRVAVGDVVPPLANVLARLEQAAGARVGGEAVGVGQVRQVGDGEVVAGEVLGLLQTLLVDVQQLLQVLLPLLEQLQHLLLLLRRARRPRPLLGVDHGDLPAVVVLLGQGRRQKCQAEDHLGAGRVEALRLGLQPLLDGRPLQCARADQVRVPLLRVLVRDVAKDSPGVCTNATRVRNGSTHLGTSLT